MITRAHRERVEGYIEHRPGRGRNGQGRAAAARRTSIAAGTSSRRCSPDCTNDMRVSQEEIFGPVVVAIPHDGIDDAIAIANDSPFGLSGTVWTEDADAALDVARRVRTGTFALNTLHGRPDDAVRRLQAVRHRARDGRRGPRGLRRVQVDRGLRPVAGLRR